MKKGIVLLMSLLFITTLSGFILQSLEHTDSMIESSIIEDEKTQLHLSIHNIKEQVMNMVYQKKEKPEEILPINELKFGVEKSLDVKINTIELFNKKINIYKQTFSTQLSDYIKDKEISSNKQLQAILTNYLNTNEDQEVVDKKGNLTYFDTDLDDYIYCSFDVTLQNTQGNAIFIFNKNTKEIIDFEFTFTK